MRRSVLIDEISGDVAEIPNFVGGFLARGVLEPKNIDAVVDPTIANDNTEEYTIGSRWINSLTSAVWFCTDNATGAAVWIDNTAGAGGDMQKATYDPTNINASAFDRANMTGSQLASTLSDFDAAVGLATVPAANAAFVSGDGASNTAARHTHTNKAQLDLVTDGDHDVATGNPHGTDGDQLLSTGEVLGQIPQADGSGGVFWGAPPASGGTPDGADRAMQFNNAGAFGAQVGFSVNADNGLAVLNGDTDLTNNGAVGKGSLQVGYMYFNTNGTARLGNASGRGALSTGVLNFQSQGYGTDAIEATAKGGFAGGICDINTSSSYNSFIRATADGAFAFGSTYRSGNGSAEITASGRASMAFGHVNQNQSIIASGEGSVQFGQGTNAVNDSVAVGQKLRLNGGYAPYPLRNGDIWVAYTYPSYLDAVHVRSQNATVVL